MATPLTQTVELDPSDRKPKLGDPIILVSGVSGRDCAGHVVEVFKNGDIGCVYHIAEYPYLEQKMTHVPHSLKRVSETFRFADEEPEGGANPASLHKTVPLSENPRDRLDAPKEDSKMNSFAEDQKELPEALQKPETEGN